LVRTGREDLAMLVPVLRHPLSGAPVPPQARWKAMGNVAIGPTAAIVRADFPRKIGPTARPARSQAEPED
jgi:hypothetical protein